MESYDRYRSGHKKYIDPVPPLRSKIGTAVVETTHLLPHDDNALFRQVLKPEEVSPPRRVEGALFRRRG